MLSLVIGGAGFLGSHLVDALIARGDDVAIVDNLSTGSIGNIGGSLSRGRATFAYLDVARTIDELRTPILEATNGRRVGRMFHFASPASPNAYRAHPSETRRAHRLATLSLIELAIEHGARLVLASNAGICSEAYLGTVDRLDPHALYDEGNRFAEAALQAAVVRRALNGQTVRFFNCYGPRMARADGRLISGLAEAASAGNPFPIHGDGLQTRSMTFVLDAIRLLLLIHEDRTGPFEPVDIGSDDERSVLIARAFARVAGVSFDIEHCVARPGDPRCKRPDLARVRSLGHVPRTTLSEGLALTIRWLQENASVYA